MYLRKNKLNLETILQIFHFPDQFYFFTASKFDLKWAKCMRENPKLQILNYIIFAGARPTFPFEPCQCKLDITEQAGIFPTNP